MAGLSPKLPLQFSTEDGYALNKTYVDVVKQNFTNLLLTVPGERIMDPDFGVGVRTFLFEIDNQELRSNLSSKIMSQAGIYLPFIEVVDIAFKTQSNNINVDPNLMYVEITYIITPLDFVDKLDITIPNY